MQSTEVEVSPEPVWAKGEQEDQAQDIPQHGLQLAVWEEVSTPWAGL